VADDWAMTARVHAPALLTVALCGVLAVAACGGTAAPGTSGPAASDAPTAAGPATPGPSATAGPASPDGSPAQAVRLDQAWATEPLVDVTTGATFRIADLAGRVLIVETMAIWCTKCRAQQHIVEDALERLPAERVVYLVLDVDPNEDGPSLAAYREKNGFSGRYAVATTAVARALAADFGDNFLNPPSTPIVIIGADGTVMPTDFGQKSADQIVALAIAGGA